MNKFFLKKTGSEASAAHLYSSTYPPPPGKKSKKAGS